MSDADYQYDQHAVPHFVDDSIVADTDTPQIFPRLSFFDPRGRGS